MSELAISYFSEIRELVPLYLMVKENLIEAEYLEGEQKTYVGPINEQRMVLDHIMLAATQEKGEGQLKHLIDARKHLIRTGHDIFEILIADMLEYIVMNVETYPGTVINEAFPIYRTEIQPEVFDIQRILTEYRSDKGADGDPNDDHFEVYTKFKNTLKRYKGIVNGYLPKLAEEEKRQKAAQDDLANEEKRRRRLKWGDRAWGAFALLIISFIGKILWSWFSNGGGE